MAIRPVNKYDGITTEWFLGDEGDIVDHIQGRPNMPKEFDPQKGRLYLEYIQLGLTPRQAALRVPVPESHIISWRRGAFNAPQAFVEAVRRAEHQQAHAMAHEIVDIADGTDRLTSEATESMADEIKNPFTAGNVDRFREMREAVIARTGERISTRRWIASKLLPNTYGDRVNVEHTGDAKKPVAFDVSSLSTEQLEKIAALEAELKNGH